MDFIPLVDLTQQYQALAPMLSAQVQAVLASGQYINGPFVARFEQQFSQFLSQSIPDPVEVVGCNSGTDALYMALRALNIGPGDEVLTSAFSFFASAEVISQTGARPIFVDIDPITFNLDPTRLLERITPRTRAVIPVHLFGQAVNMTAVMALAQQYHLAVIEDCAQAVGSYWAGRPVGTFGDLSAFSFFPTKNLGGCGDGGAVATTDAGLAEQIRVLKDHGSRQLYRHEVVGMNSRLDALQAAILSVKLPHLTEWNARRRSLSQNYTNLLNGIPDLILPQEPVGGSSVWNQYSIRIVSPETGQQNRRDQVQKVLQEMGISSRVYYPVPLHLQEVYQPLGYQLGDYPMAELCAAQVLSLPLFPELMESQQEQVAAGVRHAMLATSVVHAGDL